MAIAVSLVVLVLAVLYMACLPAGVAVAIRGRKKPSHIAAGVFLVLLSIPVYIRAFFVVPSIVDDWRGWEMSVPMTVPGYEIRLVQKPGVDFYDSYFEVVREDGAVAKVWIDADDSKWWNPEVAERDGRIYFTRGLGLITDDTPYIDSANDVIYSPFIRQTHTLSELEFE